LDNKPVSQSKEAKNNRGRSSAVPERSIRAYTICAERGKNTKRVNRRQEKILETSTPKGDSGFSYEPEKKKKRAAGNRKIMKKEGE